MKVTDDQVFTATEAGEAEMKCWRVLEWPERGSCAVRDRFPLPEYSERAVVFSEKIERFDFDDATHARQYVKWRGMKAALESL